LSPPEMALFDLLKQENLSKADREKVKQASRSLLARIHELLASMDQWTRNAQTQAEVQTSILDWLCESLPQPPFTEGDTTRLAERLYEYVWQQSEAGAFAQGANAS
jgi:type I restriction enzyme, R subunit